MYLMYRDGVCTALNANVKIVAQIAKYKLLDY